MPRSVSLARPSRGLMRSKHAKPNLGLEQWQPDLAPRGMPGVRNAKEGRPERGRTGFNDRSAS